MTSNIPAAGGSPVRRSDLSEHVLYDLDATDWFADCEEQAKASTAGDADDLVDDAAELARMAADWAENAPDSAGRNPFLR